jgi:hypothetical protein
MRRRPRRCSRPGDLARSHRRKSRRETQGLLRALCQRRPPPWIAGTAANGSSDAQWLSRRGSPPRTGFFQPAAYVRGEIVVHNWFLLFEVDDQSLFRNNRVTHYEITPRFLNPPHHSSSTIPPLTMSDSQDYLSDRVDEEFLALVEAAEHEAEFLTPPSHQHAQPSCPNVILEADEYLSHEDAAAFSEAFQCPVDVVERFEPPEDMQYPFHDGNSSQQLDQEVGEDWIPEVVAAAVLETKAGDNGIRLINNEEQQQQDPPYEVEEVATPDPSRILLRGAQTESLDAKRSLSPFIRGPFPQEVQPRGLVEGLSTRTLLKTCFRIGEALRVGIARQRQQQQETDSSDVLVELYGISPSTLRNILTGLCGSKSLVLRACRG